MLFRIGVPLNFVFNWMDKIFFALVRLLNVVFIMDGTKSGGWALRIIIIIFFYNF